VLVVDSSVWIDFFKSVDHPAVELLDQMLDHGEVRIVVPDLVLFEVLRGFRHEPDLRQARRLLEGLDIETTGGMALALEAAQHYRGLRAQGFTVRSGIDVLIAAFCIENDYALLHRDRDFEAFEALRGLRGWRHRAR
jgi:predicted nucleic acid-binding protein